MFPLSGLNVLVVALEAEVAHRFPLTPLEAAEAREAHLRGPASLLMLYHLR